LRSNLAALMAALGVPGAPAAAVTQARAAARRANAVATASAYVVVPLAAGGLPAAWPAGLDRAALWNLTGAAASALLLEFGLAANGSLDTRRMRLARHIGVME